MWPKNGGFPLCSFKAAQIVCCSTNVNASFFPPKTDEEKKAESKIFFLKFAFLNKKLSILQAIICQILLSASTARGKVQTRCSVLRS